MSVSYTLASKTRVDVFKDRASIYDAKTYSFDLTPWQADNSTVTSVDWVVKTGTASVSNTQLVEGVASALITFAARGRVLIQLTVNTAAEIKTIWLEIDVKQVLISALNDYGLYSQN